MLDFDYQPIIEPDRMTKVPSVPISLRTGTLQHGAQPARGAFAGSSVILLNEGSTLTCAQTVAAWLTVVATLILAAVAVFQEPVRGWFYRPRFRVIAKTEPPHCVAVPITDVDGTFVANSVYLRIWVENNGNATARNAEVYVQEVRLASVPTTVGSLSTVSHR